MSRIEVKSPTTEQRSNLLKVLAGLKSLPEDYGNFAMGSFVSGFDDTSAVNGSILHECGTTACVIGHGPSFGVAVPPDCLVTIKGRPSVRWASYSNAVFGLRFRDFDFCFGHQWPDSIQQAIERLEIYLNTGDAYQGYQYSDIYVDGYKSE